MSFRNRNKKIVPSWILILYPLFVVFDLLSTYVAIPDLQYEGNPIICYFQWDWGKVILWNFAIVTIAVLTVLFSNKYLIKYFKKEHQNKLLFFVACFFIFCFYTHVVGLIYAVPTNFLQSLYQHENRNHFLYNITLNFVNFVYQKGSYFYLFILYFVTSLIGLAITIYRIKRIKYLLNN